MRPNWTLVGAVLGGLAVGTGAFGAHALRSHLSHEAEGWWHTAVEWHALHALALIAVGLLAARGPSRGMSRSLALAGWAFALGITLFSGSLYALALTDLGWLGAVTPFGGAALLGGWGALACSQRRSPPM